jgi:hypothetical protein
MWLCACGSGNDANVKRRQSGVCVHPSSPNWAAGSSPATLHLGPWSFQPGSEHRCFVAVPDGVTWCEVVLRAGAHDTPKLLHVRATQLSPDASYRETEWRNQVRMAAHRSPQGHTCSWQCLPWFQPSALDIITAITKPLLFLRAAG